MATFKICIYKHQRRADGKFPVSIRVCWKRGYGYIKTEYYVTDRQINKKTFEVKDPYIIKDLNERILKLEDIKSKKLGFRIHNYDAKDLAAYFMDALQEGEGDVDFVAFGRELAARVERDGRTSTAELYRRTLNGLIDFCGGRERIMASEITVSFLRSFSEYLKTERTMTRKNHGKDVTVKRPAASGNTVAAYLTDIRTIFNKAVEEFNDDEKDIIRIPHYPFKKVKIVRNLPEKRNVTAEKVAMIRDLPDDKINRRITIMARDVFMLIFYLCGINIADILTCPPIVNGRIEYKRQKTRKRRKDEAFISILIQPECEDLVRKYADPAGRRAFGFYHTYKDRKNFARAVNNGLKDIADLVGEDKLTTYFARHAWSTIGRNRAGVSVDDIDLSLNHVDQAKKMADVYIEKDWSLIDAANRKIIDYLNSFPAPESNQSDETPKSFDK